MEVRYNWNERAYEIKEKLSNGQTLVMQFQELEDTNKYHNYNVALAVYSKRKHAIQNETEKKITSKVPLESALKAMKAFDLLERYVIDLELERGNNILICVDWIDERRRRVYEKFLKPRGYHYNNHTLIKKVCAVSSAE